MAIRSAQSRADINTPVRQGLELLCQTFGAEIDSWQRRAYEKSLDGIPADILAEAVQRLIDEAAGGRKFYPVPNAPDWKGMCAKVMTERRKAAAAIHLEGCEHSSHWIELDGVNQRCPCWKRAQVAMEQVGQAIALPPAREEPLEVGS